VQWDPMGVKGQLVRYVSERKQRPLDSGRCVGASTGVGCKCR
jgi:hypothetical protein